MLTASVLLLALVCGAVGVVLYRELRNQHHIWNDQCVTPEQTRAEMLCVLEKFQDAVRDAPIVWWLDYGTMLGAWRLNRPMAFDHDLDISFLAADVAALDACRPKLSAAGIELDLSRTSIFYGGRKIGDIEPWTLYDGKLCRDDPATRQGVMRFWRRMFDDFPKEWIVPTCSIRFGDRMYPCPNSLERFLRHRYLTCRLHLRLAIPHKQKCWFCRAFWQEFSRIWRFRAAEMAAQDTD